MKAECAFTRKMLPRYMRGLVFKLTRNRIDRHLRSCAVCSSEYDTLKRVEETRLLLRYVSHEDGVGHRLRSVVAAIGRLRIILYRPSWLGLVVLALAFAYFAAMMPREIDQEIESIVKTAPTRTTSPDVMSAAVPSAATEPTPTPAPMAAPPQTAAVPAVEPALEPLAITITADDASAAIQRLNDVMRGHGKLRKKRFTDDVREVSGSLTVKELLTFFGRIEQAGKVAYSRKRFGSLPEARPVPFVLKLKILARPAEKPARPAASPPSAAEQTGSAPASADPSSSVSR